VIRPVSFTRALSAAAARPDSDARKGLSTFVEFANLMATLTDRITALEAAVADHRLELDALGEEVRAIRLDMARRFPATGETCPMLGVCPRLGRIAPVIADGAKGGEATST
jgi:hypothetical protein